MLEREGLGSFSFFGDEKMEKGLWILLGFEGNGDIWGGCKGALPTLMKEEAAIWVSVCEANAVVQVEEDEYWEVSDELM